MTKNGRLLLISMGTSPIRAGFSLRHSRVTRAGGGGNSLTSNIIHSIRLFAASLSSVLAVLLFPFSGIGAPDAFCLIIVASFIVMGARVVWQCAPMNDWRHPGRLESVPV